MKTSEYYAHSSGHGYEKLIDHLELVAKYAKNFGDEFNQGKTCKQLGLIHDIGKRTKKFQDVLFHRNEVHSIDHAIVGAKFFWNHSTVGPFLKAYLSAIIGSHHSDISFLGADYNENDYVETIQTTGKNNALSNKAEYEEILRFIFDNKLDLHLDNNDCFQFKGSEKLEAMLYVRMLFSCLVDADYTATAEFEDKDYFEETEPGDLKPDILLRKLNQYRENLIAGSDQTEVMSQLRSYVYSECKTMGKLSDNEIYTLNAPTGTGKTLALIEFALECAKKNNKKKIFVVLPYLSIISQNSEIYRQIFGADIVLEDSSTVEYTDETKMYSERWSSPIIVTTSVKFFETMFKSKASELRRLHQIANSIIVFDECQTLPPKLLDSTIRSLQSLVIKYNDTVLLSTATLPAYQYRKNIEWNATEIINDVKGLYEEYGKIKNTTVETDCSNTYTAKDLADKMGGMKQCLYIFNTVKKAEEMYETLLDSKSENSVFLITSNMCNRHKLDTIQKIKNRLESKEECYLASTQAVEIGVDIDFLAGTREYAPLDSIIQSAGRIARNAKNHGYFFVYEHADDTYPGSFYKNSAMLCKRFVQRYGDKFDLNNPEMIHEYYSELYTFDAGKQDDQKLIENIEHITDAESFKNIAGSYKLIENEKSANIIVPYEGCRKQYQEFCEKLQNQGNCIKKNQMYECRDFTVNMNIDYITDKKKSILNHCVPIALRLSNGETLQSGWYIATEDMYDVTGLHEKKETAYVL